MMGLDKLIDKLFEWWDLMWPFYIINHYDKAIVLRNGSKRRVLGAGLYMKMPLIDEVLTIMYKPTTLNLSEQSLTTKDKIEVVVRVAMKYEIADAEKVLLEVNSAKDALSDMSQGIVSEKISGKLWSECTVDQITPEISRAIKAEARNWGIKVLEVAITDLSKMRSLRILNTIS